MFNKEKFSKYLYLLVGLLFIYNSFGYLLIFVPAKILIKEFVQKAIKINEVESEELSILAFNLDDIQNKKCDFIWIEQDEEFRFNGKMYDVKNKVVKGDSVFFACYFDDKENILDEIFSLHLIDNKKDKAPVNLAHINLPSLYFEEIKNSNLYLGVTSTTNHSLLKTERITLDYIKDIPSPPPRLAI
jgi:hypothetical protein